MEMHGNQCVSFSWATSLDLRWDLYVEGLRLKAQMCEVRSVSYRDHSMPDCGLCSGGQQTEQFVMANAQRNTDA